MNLTDEQKPLQRVVCAALRHEEGGIIIGPRHFDATMHRLIEGTGGDWNRAEQGFIDQFGNFLTREEAWWVAVVRDQIIRFVGNQTPESRRAGDELYSENLY